MEALISIAFVVVIVLAIVAVLVGSLRLFGGKKLMQKAEEIALQHGKDKMVVISGVGVRKYYQEKLGYVKEGHYVVKSL